MTVNPYARAQRDRMRALAGASAGRAGYRITNLTDETVAVVDLFGEIGWDVWADEFVRDLAAITAPSINLNINSPGGDAWDGFAIYNALVMHPANVTAHITGIAASAASFIAMAGDTIIAHRPSQMMIHDASGLCFGNAADMTETAAILDQLSNEIAAVYARRAGGTVDDWRELMRAETWYGPDSALAVGLVNSIAGDDQAPPPAAPAPAPAPAESAVSRAFRARARSNDVRARARLALEGGKRQ